VVKDTELKSVAGKYKVKLSKVECDCDYAQNWLLKNLNEINMALKGGTGLRKVYFKEYRFSDDLDFTLLEDITKRTLTNKIDKAIKKAKDESGINFMGITDLEELYSLKLIYFEELHSLKLTNFEECGKIRV
jgi:predicted nucleotidyltransferase component of viral defense system